MQGSPIGYGAARVGLAATLAYGAAQGAQLAGVTTPPMDAILIYAASLCIAPAFLLAIVALRQSPGATGHIWGEAACLFAGVYLMFALLVYGVQLGTVIPYGGALPGTAVLEMRPHGLFWTIDGLAYFCMGAAAWCAGLSLADAARPRLLRAVLLGHGAVTPLIAWVYFHPGFGPALLTLASPWLVTAIASFWLLSRHFRSHA